MTIKQRGKDKICSAEFYVDKKPYRFSFNGKKGMPLITSKTEARKKESELKHQILADTFVSDSSLKNFGKFFQDKFMEYSRENKTDRSIVFDEYYGGILLGEFSKYDLGEITARMIERFMVKLSKTETKYGQYFSPVTIRMIYARLNQLFNLAAREKIFLDNPCKLVSPSVLKGFPTWQPRERWLNKYDPEEEEKLFAELDPQIATISRLFLDTGLRPPYELLKAEKSHVNLSEKSVHYRFTKRDGKHLEGKHVIIPPRAILVVHGKDKTTRLVPLNNSAQGILKVLCDDRATGDWLFTNRTGDRLASIKKGFAAACRRAGIENLRPHDLRGTFATRLMDRGIPLTVISALLGHSKPMNGFGRESRITLGYARATWDMMVWAVGSLEGPPLFENAFQTQSGKSQAKQGAEGKTGKKLKVG
jgi:integrase